MSKLTPQQKEEIIQRYKLHIDNTPQKLQEEYGIKHTIFWRIVRPNERKMTNIRNMIYITQRSIKEGRCRDVKKAEKRIEDLRQQLANLVNK